MVQHLLGVSPVSPIISEFLNDLNGGEQVPTPEVKSYSDAVYLNYYSLGISLLFTPAKGYKPSSGLKYADLDTDRLSLDGIDVYNTPKVKDMSKPSSTRPSEVAFATYSRPLTINLAANVQDKDGKPIDRPSSITITDDTTGKDFVSALGEPDRKGGGAGPSSGSIGIWCEWAADGLMVEFGGDESRGPQAWERGKDAFWRVVTIFVPKRT
ncbi:hypothetical protein BKA70DRAFT_1250833 [Coprinopsis sp. MPI-PUGE-AT-0042]|nr:hypothetical protein BKA70DRAFT_1250833 [Coprinopsis sp. MPI-PUGE-AT-0042]